VAASRTKNHAWYAEAEAMWNAGVGPGDIARHFGVTKNVIIGLGRRRWRKMRVVSGRQPPSTLHTRLDAIHAKFDAVMAELDRNKARHYYAAE
jgi:hypothetical protein